MIDLFFFKLLEIYLATKNSYTIEGYMREESMKYDFNRKKQKAFQFLVYMCKTKVSIIPINDRNIKETCEQFDVLSTDSLRRKFMYVESERKKEVLDISNIFKMSFVKTHNLQSTYVSLDVLCNDIVSIYFH